MATQMGAGELVGHRVLDNDGNSVGKIGQIYYDDETNDAKWVTVRTGLFGNHESFVPLRGAQKIAEDVQVPYGKQAIKDAPHFDVGQRISMEEERRIYRHYNIPHPGVPGPRGSTEDMQADEAGSGRHEASSTSAPGAETETGTAAEMDADTQEASMMRHEEQVRVDAERRESGRLHLRKHVDTEEFAETVPLTHEEVTLEREPVDGAEAGEAGDTQTEGEDQEITLHEERATVSRESVPVERVRVRKDEVTEEQTVRGERRKERVELEDDDSPPAE